MRVIAEAYGREPLDRQLLEHVNGLCYLVPLGGSDVEPDEVRGVGFPEQYVFAYDEQLLRELDDAYRHGDRERLDDLWGKAHSVLATA